MDNEVIEKDESEAISEVMTSVSAAALSDRFRVKFNARQLLSQNIRAIEDPAEQPLKILSEGVQVKEVGPDTEDIKENENPASEIPPPSAPPDIKDVNDGKQHKLEDISLQSGPVSPLPLYQNPLSDGKERIVLLPIENLTDDKDAVKHVVPSLLYALENKGLDVIYGGDVGALLCRERIRSTGYVSRKLAAKIQDEFKVKAVLMASILSYSSEEDPKFGILVRLVDTSRGTIIWADYASATGKDFTTILGLGELLTIESLIPRVVHNVIGSFGVDKLHQENRSARKIAVVPFQNNSEYRNAGTIAMYIFLVELLKSTEYEPVEYGDIRNMIVDLRIRDKGGLDYKNVKAIAGPLEASGVLVGVVDNYTEGIDAVSPPKVTISARLLDGSRSRILWYNSRELSGEEDVKVFDWGRLRSVHQVARKIVSRLVKEMGTVNWD